MKKEIPLAITFLTGVIIVVTFFIPHQPFGSMQQRLLIWYSIVLGFTLLLGVVGYYGVYKGEEAINEIGIVRLPSVQALLTMSKEQNTIDSAENGGTTVTVLLPLAREAAAGSRPEEFEPAAGRSRHGILPDDGPR